MIRGFHPGDPTAMADTPLCTGTIDLTPQGEHLISDIRWLHRPGAVGYWHRGDDQDAYTHNMPLVIRLLDHLQRRDAIPAIRVRYFTDPEFNTARGKKSHRATFEANGSVGHQMLQHPHFLSYLWYFIHPARLPRTVKDHIARLSSAPFADAIETATACRALARQQIRAGRIDPVHDYNVDEEFFKLALDCRMSLSDAYLLRRHVKAVVSQSRRAR